MLAALFTATLAIAGSVTAEEEQRMLAPFRQLRESRGFWRSLNLLKKKPR